MLASTFGHYLGCFSFGRAYAIDAKDNRVPDRAGKQPQRTVLPTQQIVGKIQTAQHIKTCTRNAYGRDCMVVHSTIVGLIRGSIRLALAPSVKRPSQRRPTKFHVLDVNWRAATQECLHCIYTLSVKHNVGRSRKRRV